jgi:hypothetical protein
VAYFVDSAVGIINEGDTMTFNVTTTAVPDGTVLYWKVENETTTDARFAAVSGSVTVTAGAGSFGVSPLADHQTEGTTLFHVTLRTGSVAGTVVWTTGSKAVGDTSLTPPVHGSGVFNQPQEDYLTITAPSYTAAGAGSGAYSGNVTDAPILKGDYPQPQPGWTAIGHAGDGPYRVTLTNVVDGGGTWILHWNYRDTQNLYKGQSWTLYDPTTAPFNLGTTWTIEFWIKANNPSGAGINIPGGQWGLVNQGGWYGGIPNNSILIGLAAGYLTIAQDSFNDIEFAEPTAGIWTHVAVVNNGGGSAQKVYYNGVEQTKTSGSYQSNGWTNVTADLYIGRLAPPYASHFDGKITNLRMTNTAEYTGNFTPALLPGVVAGHTRLLWAPTDQAYFTNTGNSVLTLTNNGVTIDTGDYPS